MVNDDNSQKDEGNGIDISTTTTINSQEGINNNFNDTTTPIKVKAENNNNEEAKKKMIETSSTTANLEDSIDDNVNNFVTVELASPQNNKKGGQQKIENEETEERCSTRELDDIDAAPTALNDTDEATINDLKSSLNYGDDRVVDTMHVPPATATTNNNNNNDGTITALALNIQQDQPKSSSAPTITTTTRRRKILHHPLLSHITKLPWDRFTNAAGACDVLFNCKYSMRQVEDEVREEYSTSGNLHQLEYGTGVTATTTGVGREDGYMNVSLGCDDYQYQEEGCETEEFEQVLGCCSMLDNSDDDDEEEDVECVSPTNNNIDSVGQEKGGDDDDDNDDEGKNNAETVVVVEERDHSGVNGECIGSSGDNNIIGDQKQQQSDGCWQQTNPSLDMMLYRQFLNE